MRTNSHRSIRNNWSPKENFESQTGKPPDPFQGTDAASGNATSLALWRGSAQWIQHIQTCWRRLNWKKMSWPQSRWNQNRHKLWCQNKGKRQRQTKRWQTRREGRSLCNLRPRKGEKRCDRRVLLQCACEPGKRNKRGSNKASVNALETTIEENVSALQQQDSALSQQLANN